jgi:cysteinyl-tRNA synthetase
MALRVYNTLTRKKEDFKPVHDGKVSIYLCGPTVYKPSHVGHMVGPVIFDTVKRYLAYLGYEVTFVVNITDIDDKIIKEAAAQKRDWKELAESVTADYLDHLKRLGVTSIDHFPRATDYVGEIQRIIGGLIDKGFAYPSGGDVYFDVTKDPDYGKLCNRDPEQLEAGARIEVSERKRNPGDFALWKGAKPGEPKWDSPWGPGRPGWHIECSAMSMKLLGQTLDIHGGGLDLQFPHHENELAQSESLTGETFARYWMHNGLMKTGDQKMSKSAGNEIVVSKLLKPAGQHEPETLRFLLLGTHYRSPIEYSEARLAEVKRSLERFYTFFDLYERLTGTSYYKIEAPAKIDAPTRHGEFRSDEKFLEKVAKKFREEVGNLRERFLECMDDDFNTGGAVGVLFYLLNALNRFVETKNMKLVKDPPPLGREGFGFSKQRLDDAKENFPHYVALLTEGARTLKELSQLLGVFQEPPAKGGDDKLVGGLMQLLLDVRNDLRAQAKKIAAKDDPVKKALFEQTDVIRKRLGELGVTLEDRPGSTGWRIE